MDEVKTFSSPSEEVKYWKKLAHEYKTELDETKEELEEFQVSSHELEQELETQLKQEEKRNKELTSANSRLQTECDSLKERLQKLQMDSHKRSTELEDKLANVEALRNELNRYVRELEQDNDDLERAKRATVASLEDFEHRLNEAIERNAFLESELDEKEALVVTVQRLKDEARDLKSEIVVRKPTHGESQSTSASTSQPMHDSGYSAHVVTPTTPTTPMNRVPQTPGLSNSTSNGTGTPLTPSARISALNIVGDLLRKVGSMVCRRNARVLTEEALLSDVDDLALESKLATCRNFVKDEPRSKSATSPLNSPRTKRLNRGSSLPVQQGLKMSV